MALVKYPLCLAALEHARWMARNGECSHGTGADSFTTRMMAHNIIAPRAEDVAATVNLVAIEEITAWMGSQGHHDNIINPAFTDIGVGIAKNAAAAVTFT